MSYKPGRATGSTWTCRFHTADTDGAAIGFSATIEVADFDIYKGTSATQRSSTSGFAIAETFDSVTGAHVFSADLSDNTDAGFYSAGADLGCLLSPDETVDALTVVAWVGECDIESTAGYAARQLYEKMYPGHVLGASGSHSATVMDLTGVIDADTPADALNGEVGLFWDNSSGVMYLVEATDFAATTLLMTMKGLDGITLPIPASGDMFWRGGSLAGLLPTAVGRKLDVTATGAAGIDFGNVENPTTTVGLTGTTIATSQVVASVSGAVGSVTGAVGSVTGAVGSVTGAVGSVTGNVGGNVTGTVASVVGSVGGNVTGSVGSVVGAVGSVSGAVGSVTGAVGSVTGNVGGNVTGSVGSVATGGIAAASFAAGAIDAAALAADAGTEIATAVWASATRTLTALDEDSTTIDLDAAIIAAFKTAVGAYDVTLSGTPTATSCTVDVDVSTDVRTGFVRLTSGALTGEARPASHTGTTITVGTGAHTGMPTAWKQFSTAPATGVTATFFPMA